MRRSITPNGEEVRQTDTVTGGEKGAKLQRYELIPVAPLEEVAKLYGVGAAKYANRNWERGYSWSLSYASLQRHSNAFWDGESIDEETERHHLASVIFHAMALMEFELKGLGTDDRAPVNVAVERPGETVPEWTPLGTYEEELYPDSPISWLDRDNPKFYGEGSSGLEDL